MSKVLETGNPHKKTHIDHLWWQEGIIYQIYPRSFADGNSDGVGDLKGIISRLGYLKWLGVSSIWISPIYPSPMADFGYDISDYCNIDPLFGTLEDFDELLDRAHEAGLRVILDFVPNHTSNQHPWFLESRSSRDNPKRDWYLWHDPREDGGVPNNWRSVFGGSAWEWDETTGQYYYHGFLKEQPDLNWRNPQVQRAMFDVLRFWLERGVDGFRVDVLWHMIKDKEWRDNPPNPHYDPSRQGTYEGLIPKYSTDQPEVHEVIQQLRKVISSYGNDRVFIGEVYLPTERLMAYYGPDGDGANMPYNFQLTLLPWDCDEIMRAIDRYEGHLPPGAWPNWVLGNHDRPRIASRVQPHQIRGAQMLLLTLRGTPTMYYGDELGMRDVPIPPDLVQDPFEKREPGMGNGRDPQRTPMPWDAQGGGFTRQGATPWLPMGENDKCSVARQQAEEDSLLNMVRELIQLRQSHDALKVGIFQALPSHAPIAAFTRQYADEILYILINFDAAPQEYPLPEGNLGCIFSTSPQCERGVITHHVTLNGGEGIILKVH